MADGNFIEQDYTLFELATEAPLRVCSRIGCLTTFNYVRNTKLYCSDNCRKRATETPQNSIENLDTRRRNLEYFDRVKWALINLIQQGEYDRSQWLQDYIDNPTSARIVGSPKLLTSHNNNIAKVANRFTQQVYRCSIKTYLKNVRDNPNKLLILYDYTVFEEQLSGRIIGAA